MSHALVSIEQIRAIDRGAQDEFAIPELVLMEGAGLLAWQAIADLAGDHRICVLAGRGNNGGDALVMARYALIAGHEVVVVRSGEPRSGSPTALHLESVRLLGASLLRVEAEQSDGEQADAGLPAARAAIESAELVIDGMAGSGISGSLRPPFDTLAAIANDSGATIVSVDVPSGLYEGWAPGEPIVHASRTLELGLPKFVCYSPASRPCAGVLVQVPIGFPPALTCHADSTDKTDGAFAGSLLESNDLSRFVSPIGEAVHKGVRGRLSVWGGADGMAGAAVLAAESALRARAGLATIRTEKDSVARVAALTRSVMVRDNAGDPEPGIVSVVGPGWGRTDDRAGLLRRVIEASSAGVIDADGLHALAAIRRDQSECEGICEGWVLTPHPGELAVLARASGEQFALHHCGEHAARLAAWSGAVVVAKGPATWIVDPRGRIAVVDGMNAALATAGTGDVLAGTIGGLIASGTEPFAAACGGVLAHQSAGARLRMERGFFLSEELPVAIGKVLDGR